METPALIALLAFIVACSVSAYVIATMVTECCLFIVSGIRKPEKDVELNLIPALSILIPCVAYNASFIGYYLAR